MAKEKDKDKDKDKEQRMHSLPYYFNRFGKEGMKGHKNFIPTGFTKLDNKLGGGLWSGLTVVGAVPSLGKSTLMLQIAENVSKNGTPVLYFSLEMPGDYISAKAIARNYFYMKYCNNSNNEKQVDPSHPSENKGFKSLTSLEIMKAESPDNLERRYPNFTTSRNSASDNNKMLYLYDSTGADEMLTTTLIDKIVREFIENNGPAQSENKEQEGKQSGEEGMESKEPVIKESGAQDLEAGKEDQKQRPLVIIDYLQLLVSDESSNKLSDKQEIDKSVRILSKLSREMDIPVVVISSLNRESYNEKVRMESLKESGGIEYAADTILGVSFVGAGKGFDVEAAKGKTPREIEITVLKQRYGESGDSTTVQFDYYSRYDYFCEKGEDGIQKEPKSSKNIVAAKPEQTDDSGQKKTKKQSDKSDNEIFKGTLGRIDL